MKFRLRRSYKRFVWVAFILGAIVFLLRLWPHPPLEKSIPLSTAFYDEQGKLIRLALASDEQYRLWIPLKKMDPRFVKAVQLYEDKYFYWHLGINPMALARAVFSTYGKNLKQGGSTLTMQLARRYYRIPSQSLSGKFKQIGAAFWLELRYSKAEILEAYLNLAPYGGNIEGVGAASLIYFHKQVERLTLTEAITLAVIPQNPNRRGLQKSFSPKLMTARSRLFQNWLKLYPQDQKYQADFGTFPRTFTFKDLPFRAPHFTDKLLQERGQKIRPKTHEIFTTLDLNLQTILERMIAQFVTQHRSQGVYNATALLLHRRSGEVKAMVGSADYFNPSINGQVNGVAAKRSPGSTLKPFIYGLALDQGVLHPLSVLKDAPTSFGPFSPENFDGRFVGPITAQDALVRSRNVPAMAVSAKLSHPNLYEFLKQAGVQRLASEHHYGLALTLGGGEVSMEELARLYLMLANRGQLLPISSLKTNHLKAPQLLSEEAAFIVLDMLQRNPRPDTEAPARPPVAWKTGTSWGFRDAWTAGVFDAYVLVVWVGNFDNQGNPVFIGIKSAAPLFFKIVDALRSEGLASHAPKEIPPKNLTLLEVCAASGDLPNAWCKDRAWTWFIPGKSPIKVSTLHRPVAIDTRTKQTTCETGEHVKIEVYEYWPTDLQRLFREAGMPRRMPPVLPDCAKPWLEVEDGPKIISPKYNTTYMLRVSKPNSLSLQANVKGSGEKIFWFANDSLIGQSQDEDTLTWSPIKAGLYQVRAIDSEGRSDVRQVRVEFVP